MNRLECIRTAAAAIALIFLSAGVHAPGLSAAEEESAGAGAVAESAIYAYGKDDMPAVFFFPKEKARWDGSKVTMKEWYMLTDLQKEKFVTEYLNQVQADSGMGFDALWMDYLRALNLFSVYSNEKVVNEPSTKFIDKMLTGQGKAVPKAGPAEAAAK